jgi:diguanylate cyclase (GGDEF)-like protein
MMPGIGDYHLCILAGMVDVLEREGIPLWVVLHESFASTHTSSLVLDLLRPEVALGVIALTGSSQAQEDELLQEASTAGVPVVSLGMSRPGIPSVTGDNVTGIQDLVRHLVDDCGLRRLRLVRGLVHQPDSMIRERAFREGLAARGIPVDEALVIDGDFRQDTSYKHVWNLLGVRRDVDAIVALNDPSALGVLAAMADHGLTAPSDIAVSGFDNTLDSALSWPDLTTIDQDLTAQGRRAAELLLQVAAGRLTETQVIVPSRLVVRTSTAGAGGAPTVRVVEGVSVVDLVDHRERLDHVVKITQALHERVTTQEAARLLSLAMANCRTVDDIVTALGPCLQRMGVRRCFMGLTRTGAAAGGAPGVSQTQRQSDEQMTLVFSYRHAGFENAPSDAFPRRELLPAALCSELHEGVLVFQPLSIAGREQGYLMYEPSGKSAMLADAMRIALPRTVDSVLSWQELKDHAATLQELVTQRTQELQRANEGLRQLAMRDGLTGIANRSAFQQHLARGWAHDRSGHRQWALLMIDIDMFKAFNDRYGHLAGDEALRKVSSCLVRSTLRSEDLVCRYGGEEFAVVLPDTGIRGAVSVATRFRALLAAAAIPHESSTVAATVTASVGAAAMEVVDGSQPADLIAAADRALYRAKDSGRNRTVVDGQQQPKPSPSVPPRQRTGGTRTPSRPRL